MEITTLQGGQEVGTEHEQGHESRHGNGYGGYKEPYRYLRWGSWTPNCMQSTYIDHGESPGLVCFLMPTSKMKTKKQENA